MTTSTLTRTCRACEGTGRLHDTAARDGRLCSYCRGSGEVSAAQPESPKHVLAAELQADAASTAACARNNASAGNPNDDRIWFPTLTEADRVRCLAIAVKLQREAAGTYGRARSLMGIDPRTA